MARQLEPQQLPPAVAQHQKCEQPLQGQSWDHTSVDGSDRLRVVSKERLPALRRRATLHHVFRDRRLGDLEAQHQQFAMEAGCSPLRVFPAHPSDEVTQAPIDPGSPCPVPRFPPPERLKARTVPPKNGLWLTCAAPSRLGQIRVIQIRSTRSALRNRRRGGARLKAMLSWWRRNRFSASSRHGGLNKSTMNIPSECRIASIGRDHAMILPHDANPKPDGIFGKDRWMS